MTLNYIALAIPFFFLLIAIELFVARWQRLAVYRFNDAVTDLGCGIGQQVTGVFVKGALVAGYAYVFEHYAVVRFAETSPIPWIVAFVGVDFAYYWWHRLSHEVALLWAVHVVHHQSEDYNLAVALRQAWFSSLTSWSFYLPLAFVGVPPLVFVAVASASTLYQFWIHTQTIGRLGPLEWVLNTASHHRVHHGRNPKYLDRNYAATLIVWDRLFGSFQEEEEPPLYGVVEPYASWNPIWANFDYWAHLARKARSTPRWADKLRVWIKPPGWVPPGAPAPRGHDVAAEPAIRYATASSRATNVYILVQFLPVVVATSALMVTARPLSALAAGVAILVLATLLVWGGLFERKSWAVPLELARLAGVLALAGAVYASGLAPASAVAAAGVFAAGCAVWVLRLRTRMAVDTPAVV